MGPSCSCTGSGSVKGNEAAVAALTAEDVIAASLVIIPSAPRTALIPSAPRGSGTSLIPSAPRSSFSSQTPTTSILSAALKIPSGLIPSAPRLSSIIPSQSPTAEGPSLATPPTISPSDPQASSIVPPPIHTGLIPSAPILSIPQTTQDVVSFPTVSIPTLSNGTNIASATNVVPSLPIPGMTSTEEGLHPIPAPSTNPGDPDGHHEIPEPNFTITLPCRGCSPVIEITATGWETVPSIPIPPAQEQETKASSTVAPPVVTISAGPSNVIVKPGPSGGNVVIGDSTVKPGQTVTVGGTPVAVDTSGGHTNVVIGGTQTVPLQPPYSPPTATITAGSSAIIVKPAPSGSDFLVGSSTVHRGQTITISNTPIAIQTSGSHVEVVIGGTQTIPLTSPDSTITDAPVLLPVTLDQSGQILTPIPPSNIDPDHPLRTKRLHSQWPNPPSRRPARHRFRNNILAFALGHRTHSKRAHDDFNALVRLAVYHCFCRPTHALGPRLHGQPRRLLRPRPGYYTSSGGAGGHDIRISD
ncbi:hypothetical protein N0V90_005614 [Kalmusia sp. IMI 367209]|nr:hypothetical protein N0V90_005614 [Kalmusia sp. IMI 367209]